MKWHQASGVLCDKRVPHKLKCKFYRTAIRPALLYGAEYWPTKRRHVLTDKCRGNAYVALDLRSYKKGSSSKR